LARIERLNPQLGAFVTVTPELAREQAQAAERAYAEGTAGLLAGVPVSIKDLSPTRGIRTTFGSLLYAEHVPDVDSPDVARIYAAGAVMLGKTNTPEFGWKGDSDNRVLGPTRNPWNLEQTAGSVRIPASFCGIVGLKPSHGRVPRVPSSMYVHSHIGPMTRTIADNAMLLQVTAGADARDRFSIGELVDFVDLLDVDLKGWRVAWSPDLGYATVDPEVRLLCTRAAARFSELGCEVVDDQPPAPDPYFVSEVTFTASQYSRHLDDFQRVRGQLDQGRAEWLEQQMARIGRDELLRAFAEWDGYYHVWRRFMEDYELALTPTLATTAFPAGDHQPALVDGQPTTHLGWTGFSYPFNLTGQPAITVPCGFTSDGLPVGLQIVGRWRDDLRVLQAAHAFEQLQPWSDRRPPLD
jgi:aspartyl-tRNA(Asn)/glutamyl-tRNA(Gln) amidotransferase subunit A